ncbi:MAG: ABC transporter ATP-binding protein [Pseudomonadota bacterium]
MRSDAIRVVGLNKSYELKTALNSIDLTIKSGETFGIIGPNGAGKTTLVEILNGLRSADSGSVEILGEDMSANPAAVQGKLGVQLQDSRLLGRASSREYLKLFQAMYGVDVDIAGLAEKIGFADSLDKKVSALSGGQLQRLTLALALISDPEIIFLDEPTTGLDPIARRELWSVIAKLQKGGRTIVLVTHYMEEIERLCDRVALVVGGEIKAIGTPAEVASQSMLPGANLDDAYETLVSKTPEFVAEPA